MDIHTPLFEGQKILLAPIDHEKDPEIEASWTNDAEYMRMLHFDPMRPLSAAQLKKKYEGIEKEVEESKSMIYFTIRAKSDDRLLGFTQIYWIEWTHGNGWVRLGIGDKADRHCGYGNEALRLLMRYAFSELNLFRLSAAVGEYNLPAIHLLQKVGFVEEVRRRQAVNRDGRRWDLLHLGLLAQDRKGSEA